eukprot:RCo023026
MMGRVALPSMKNPTQHVHRMYTPRGTGGQKNEHPFLYALRCQPQSASHSHPEVDVHREHPRLVHDDVVAQGDLDALLLGRLVHALPDPRDVSVHRHPTAGDASVQGSVGKVVHQEQPEVGLVVGGDELLQEAPRAELVAKGPAVELQAAHVLPVERAARVRDAQELAPRLQRGDLLPGQHEVGLVWVEREVVPPVADVRHLHGLAVPRHILHNRGGHLAVVVHKPLHPRDVLPRQDRQLPQVQQHVVQLDQHVVLGVNEEVKVGELVCDHPAGHLGEGVANRRREHLVRRRHGGVDPPAEQRLGHLRAERAGRHRCQHHHLQRPPELAHLRRGPQLGLHQRQLAEVVAVHDVQQSQPRHVGRDAVDRGLPAGECADRRSDFPVQGEVRGPRTALQPIQKTPADGIHGGGGRAGLGGPRRSENSAGRGVLIDLHPLEDHCGGRGDDPVHRRHDHQQGAHRDQHGAAPRSAGKHPAHFRKGALAPAHSIHTLLGDTRFSKIVSVLTKANKRIRVPRNRNGRKND